MQTTQNSRGRRLRLDLFDLILIVAWVASLLIPITWNATTDEKSINPNAVGIGFLLASVAVAMLAGFHYSRHHNTPRLWTAFVFGAVTASTIASIDALAHGGPDAAPWGAVVVLNTLVYTAATGISLAIGALAGRLGAVRHFHEH